METVRTLMIIEISSTFLQFIVDINVLNAKIMMAILEELVYNDCTKKREGLKWALAHCPDLWWLYLP